MTQSANDLRKPDDPAPGCVSEFYDRLIKACDQENVGEVARLLNVAGPDVPAILGKHNEYGQTLLSNALSTGNFPIVKQLVDAGANVNDGKGLTLPPLRLAIRTGRTEVLDYLLDHGGDINLSEGDSQYADTLVMNCMSPNREKMALHLLERGADFSDERKGRMGLTTVEKAARANLPTLFFWLVDHGALKPSGKLPLQVAVEQFGVKTIQACLEHSEYCKPMLDGRADQMLAAAFNETVRALLLSWRSERAITLAIGIDADTHESLTASKRRPEMSL